MRKSPRDKSKKLGVYPDEDVGQPEGTRQAAGAQEDEAIPVDRYGIPLWRRRVTYDNFDDFYRRIKTT